MFRRTWRAEADQRRGQGNDVLELVGFIQDNPQDASDAAELMDDKATRHGDILSECATAN